MKIKILTENLKTAISFLTKISKKNINFPILENILLETEKNFLVLSATDLQISLKWWILSKIEEEGKILIPSQIFSSFLNLIKEEQLEIKEEKQSLIFEIKNQKTKIQGQNPEDFPIIPKISLEGKNEINILKLKNGLENIINFTANYSIKPEISGVFFQFKNGMLILTVTDSFRLAEKKILIFENNEKIEKEGEFILPLDSAKTLIYALSIIKEENINIYFDQNQVLFEIFNKELSHPLLHLKSRLIEGSFPNYQEIIPKKFITLLELDKKLFIEALKTASIFTNKNNETELTIFKKEKKLRIFSENIELGSNESFIPLYKIDGEEIKILFNFKFLLEGLESIQSSEIFFGLSSKEGPALLKPIGDENYLYILMPIKSS
ncbi:MAG: DNA polymerase III subunit beta [Minisyncoccia bacterium]